MSKDIYFCSSPQDMFFGKLTLMPSSRSYVIMANIKPKLQIIRAWTLLCKIELSAEKKMCKNCFFNLCKDRGWKLRTRFLFLWILILTFFKSHTGFSNIFNSKKVHFFSSWTKGKRPRSFKWFYMKLLFESCKKNIWSKKRGKKVCIIFFNHIIHT